VPNQLEVEMQLEGEIGKNRKTDSERSPP